MNRFLKWLSSPIGQIFLAAAFLRLLLAPFFFHTDIKTNYYNSHFLSKGVLNIYDFLAKNPSKAVLGEFSYPPLTYLFYGSVYYPLRILLGNGFTQWLGMGNDAVEIPNLFRYLFFMKLPLFFFEFLVGFLLIKIFKDEKERMRALFFWFFNPVNLYAVVLMGQFDIVPVFLTVMALWWALNKKFTFGALALGFGAAFKSFPILFLPFLALVAGKSWKTRIKILLVGLLPYLVFILPFLSSKAFQQSFLVSGLSQRMFLLGLEIGFGEQILLVVFALLGLFLFLDWRGDDQEQLSGYFMAIPLILLAGSHFHPQWLLWVAPFLIISLIKIKKLFLATVFLLIGWLGIILLFNDKFLILGLLSPFDSGVFFLPSFKELLKDPGQVSLLTNLFHTLFSASAVWLSSLIIFQKYVEES